MPQRLTLFAQFAISIAATVGVRAQAAPCAGQPKSLIELRQVFDVSRLPTAVQMTGTWVAIGIFGDKRSHGREIAELDCDGVRFLGGFEESIEADGYSLELQMHDGSRVGGANPARADRTRSLSFPADFGGEGHPVYRCRLTSRKTLACLVDVYAEGVEFKKSPAKR